IDDTRDLRNGLQYFEIAKKRCAEHMEVGIFLGLKFQSVVAIDDAKQGVLIDFFQEKQLGFLHGNDFTRKRFGFRTSSQ
ncbi:MAG: hypothetical protein RL362_570, partial [Bacteroidota bacterium]